MPNFSAVDNFILGKPQASSSLLFTLVRADRKVLLNPHYHKLQTVSTNANKMTRWTIFLLLTGFLLLGESSCIYEQYSTAIIRNNTNKPITITLHLDTATLKNHPNFYQIPRDAFENFKNVNKPSTIIFTIDSTNNLSGTTVLEPKQILRLYEGMSAKPTFFVDKIHISYSDKNIFLNNKTDIEKVFTEKDKGHYELEIK